MYIYIYTCVSIYTCRYMYVCVYTYIYIYIYTHTCVYMYICIYIIHIPRRAPVDLPAPRGVPPLPPAILAGGGRRALCLVELGGYYII